MFQPYLDELVIHMDWNCKLGIYQCNETSDHIPTEHGSPHGHYIDDILLMAESAEQVTFNLEALLYLLIHYQCAQISDQLHPTDRVPGFPGALCHITVESTRRETPSHQVGSGPNPEERSDNSMSTSLNNRETACGIPSSPPSSPVLSLHLRGFTEDTEQQQSRLHCIHNPVPSSQGRTAVVAGETSSMERQSPDSPEGNGLIGFPFLCTTKRVE